tara:strand:- start:41279 stop:42295 length:1017 start_codon:yes stop_codon:yes gene_type:complete
MKFKNVYIHAMEYFEPTDYLSSSELENELAPLYKRLKLPEGRLELQTGIKRRGFFKELIPSDISYAAARKALSKCKFAKEDIGLLIHSSVCRDMLEPSTASFVHSKLELSPSCVGFDLSNACLGFLNSILIAGSQIESGLINNALIVSGENSWALWKETKNFLINNMDITRKSVKKYIANLTIGSMGVAFVLSNQSEGALCKIEGGIALCDTEKAHLCQGDGDTNGLMMETESVELLKAGINLAKRTWEKTKEELELFSVDHTIGHQVGVAHRDSLLENLELNKATDHYSYDQFGNTGSAAAPMTLAYHKDKFKVNDRIALLGIGSGLHSVMLGLKWN